MSWLPHLQAVAPALFESLVYAFLEGAVLAALVAVGLRLIAAKSSRTVFAIWFSALLASAIVPFLALNPTKHASASAAHPALITLPLSVATWVLAVWTVLAMVGLLRVVAGVSQIRNLRQGSRRLDLEQLGPELAVIAEQFMTKRKASILVSERVQVPTAVGFFKPAVILPAWMAEDCAGDEIRHVLLHELAHLGRRDDWTNLIQKIVKAVLFFSPGVWWMEHELSLHREMACDDAVLAETASPRSYAECLARVAEKSFLRRQMAMAQAAVSRMRQLTRRVARILDPNRAQTTALWKPAVPAVMALAVVSGFSVSQAPELVKFDNGSSSVAVSQTPVKALPSAAASSQGDQLPGVQAWTAALKTSSQPASMARGLDAIRPTTKKLVAPKATQVRARRTPRSPQILAAYKQPQPETKTAQSADARGQYVLVVETRQTITAGANGWQLNVQQLRWLVPVKQIQKPVPGKI